MRALDVVRCIVDLHRAMNVKSIVGDADRITAFLGELCFVRITAKRRVSETTLESIDLGLESGYIAALFASGEIIVGADAFGGLALLGA